MRHKSVPGFHWPVASNSNSRSSQCQTKTVILSGAKSRAKRLAWGSRRTPTHLHSCPLRQGVLTMNPQSYFFFFFAAFFGADFFGCGWATCFLAVFPGRAERFTSWPPSCSPPSCAFLIFFSFFTSSGALNDCPATAISVHRTAV